jgi:NADH-quinone oxidoreductase subunit H
LLMSNMMVIVFWGGWLAPFSFLNGIKGFIWYSFKVVIILSLFIWIRATLPRFRYDQLMALGWKTMLPLSLSWLIIGVSTLLYCNGLPPAFYGKF